MFSFNYLQLIVILDILIEITLKQSNNDTAKVVTLFSAMLLLIIRKII